jgi:ribosomal protein L11 methylase PrmA
MMDGWNDLMGDEPIQVGENFFVCYEGSVPPPKPNHWVRIRKGDLFGTGAHPSTQLALSAMQTAGFNKITGKVREPMAEIGVSSGLCALIASYGGSEEVYHLCDNTACSAAVEYNGLINGLEIKTVSLHEELEVWRRFCPEYVPMKSKYNLIISQVSGTAEVLGSFCEIYEALNHGGVCIMSGHKPRQQRLVMHRMSEFFSDIAIWLLDGWPCIIGTKTHEEEDHK